jgi:serine/threonine protein kinase
VETGVAPHSALSNFTALQELSTHNRHKTLLAKSKGGSLVSIEVLAEKPIDPDLGTTLSREGSLAARLDHDAIVRAKALLLEGDFAAVVSEFVPGVSLQRLLRFATGRGVRLPDDVGFYILSRVISALSHAHGMKDSAGAPSPILHGGVSPGCVIVGWDGTTKIGDFGGTRMRKLVEPLLGQPEPTDLPHLMAPEEARGEPRSQRADVFCVALLAVRLATGRTPYARFRESAAQLMLAMSDGEVAKLGRTRPDLPAAVKEAFDRALEADPAKRTVTMQELNDAMKGAFEFEAGQRKLAKVLERWRDGLEKTVTPWERRASLSDAAPPESEDGVAPGTLALSTEDDRPSGDSILAAAESDPLDKSSVHVQEVALAPTGVDQSLSRMGASVPEALTMPLPAMRITMPSLPVYGGPAVNVSLPPPKPTFSGPVAAISVLVVFGLLITAAVMLLQFLAGPAR